MFRRLRLWWRHRRAPRYVAVDLADDTSTMLTCHQLDGVTYIDNITHTEGTQP